MSEPVSAFAAYHGTVKSANKNKGNKKTDASKTNSPGNKNNGVRFTNGTAKGKSGNNNTKSKNKINKNQESVAKNSPAKSKKSSDPMAADLDLLATTPTKLTKEERIKQKELRKLYGSMVENIYKGSNSDSANSEMSEYTINSCGNESDEEDDVCTTEEGDEAVNDVEVNSDDESIDNDAEEFSLDALKAIKIAQAQKRKSNETDDQTEPKQNKTTTVRKSLPATNTNNTNKAGTAPKRHSMASKSKAPAPAPAAIEKHIVTNIKLEPFSPPSNIAKMNSIEEGERMFRWLINPVVVNDFYAKYWEQGICLIKREQPNYFAHLISFEMIGQMLLKNHVEYTKNLDITRYKNGKRETLNPEGRALPPAVWDQYREGCSIRLLNPQTFIPTLYNLCATMQEYFHCLVGANAYLTPAGTQGFAPHYDDIEAFVLQIEGRKRWRLYKPRKIAEHLPRFSSENFKQSEIGTPIFDEILKPGDVLYFPRGTIHQACSEPDSHSLHITLSVYQKQTYADLFERMVPIMLGRAIANNVEMRRGLPLHLWHHAGIAFSENDTEERAQLQAHVKKLVTKCFLAAAPMELIIDQAVDQLAKKYQHEALPPDLQTTERSRTVFGTVSRTNEQGAWVCDFDITIRTNVRLIRANIMRLVEEEGQMRIYYYLDNSKEYCEYEPNFIEIERREAASVEVLIRSYPEYVSVSQLPLKSDERKIGVVSALWERGLLMTEKPIK